MTNPFIGSETGGTPPQPKFNDDVPAPENSVQVSDNNPFSAAASEYLSHAAGSPQGQSDQWAEGQPDQQPPTSQPAQSQPEADSGDAAPAGKKQGSGKRGRKTPSPVPPPDTPPPPPSLADALARTIAGQHPLDVADALNEVFGRTMAVVRPIDLLRLCKSIKAVSDEWYNTVRDRIIDASSGGGPFYGYHFVEVSPSRRVNYDKLKNEFPEAYEAVVSVGDTPGRRFVLEDPE